jgi:CubicO group peptidase (beta-lactamase class C family)
VPAEKRERFATNYRLDAKGQLEVAPDMMGDYAKQPTLASGGGGLVTTAEDYYRFAQMLGNGGESGGTRVLAPSTVKLMGSNHLPKNLLTGAFREDLLTGRTMILSQDVDRPLYFHSQPLGRPPKRQVPCEYQPLLSSAFHTNVAGFYCGTTSIAVTVA